MSETRQQVMDAILTIVSNMTFSTPINGLTTWAQAPSQKLKLFADVNNQPAAYLVTHREIDEYRGLGLVRRRLDLGVWVYSKAGIDTVGAQDLDTFMEAFEAAFGQAAVDNFSTNQNTLGGLVYWCRLEGRVFKDPGDIDGQTLLVVPLSVEMP